MSSALRPASISRASTDARWGTRDNVNVGEAPSEGHRRVVDRGHLSRQHRLDLIPWLDPLDDGEHEICALFRSAFSFAGAGVYEMLTLSRALAKSPERRFASVADFADTLERAAPAEAVAIR